eukprot:5367885-Pyramimonas_sp.AAC.1
MAPLHEYSCSVAICCTLLVSWRFSVAFCLPALVRAELVSRSMHTYIHTSAAAAATASTSSPASSSSYA